MPIFKWIELAHTVKLAVASRTFSQADTRCGSGFLTLSTSMVLFEHHSMRFIFGVEWCEGDLAGAVYDLARGVAAPELVIRRV